MVREAKKITYVSQFIVTYRVECQAKEQAVGNN